jgi:hypothetical protein
MNFGSTSLFNLPDGNVEFFEFPNLAGLDARASPERHSPQHEIYYFKINRTIFKAVVIPQSYGYTIKIGGKHYLDCINISISIQNGVVTNAKIGHIQSEPECGFGTLLENGETIEFIKGALQFCKIKFPTMQYIELDDMSNIDCGISKDKEHPRRPEKPFSLPHFSIARTGKTWYENRFGATLIDNRLYTKYRSAIENLNTPVGISFETFCAKAQFTDTQASILKPFYSPEQTWMDFFNAIPKSKQCDAFFNWLPSFITGLIQNTFVPYSWVIDMSALGEVSLALVDEPVLQGGKKTGKTRRARGRRALRFLNQWW